jgi:hypothetical protein
MSGGGTRKLFCPITLSIGRSLDPNNQSIKVHKNLLFCLKLSYSRDKDRFKCSHTYTYVGRHSGRKMNTTSGLAGSVIPRLKFR